MSSEEAPQNGAIDFHGSLEEFHLPDIIQFLSGAGKTGALRVVSEAVEGVIHLDGGRIVHAVSDELAGEEAVYSLLLASTGRFDFEPGTASASRTITRSNANLLIEAARRKDEWKILSERIPDVDWVPEFVLPGRNDAGKQITLNTSEWVILSKIDGERSVRDIAKAAHLSLFQTCRLLYSLVSTELIRLRRPGPAPKETVGFPD